MVTKLERIRIGDPTKKRNRRHTVTLQQRLKTLCEKLNSNEKTLPEFLHAVGPLHKILRGNHLIRDLELI